MHAPGYGRGVTRWKPLLRALLRATPLLLAVLPGAAWAAESAVPVAMRYTVVAFVAAAWLVFAVWSIVNGARARARAAATQQWGLRLKGLLATTPAAYIVLDGDGGVFAAETLRSWLNLKQAVQALADLAPDGETGLDVHDFAALSDDVEALRASGQPFVRLVRVASGGRVLRASGRPLDEAVAGQGAIVLWFTDTTESHEALASIEQDRASLMRELDAATALLEAAPLPIWRRGTDLRLQAVNTAYVAAVEGGSAQNVVARATELVNSSLSTAPAKAAQRARDQNLAQVRDEYVIVGGARRALQIHDVPLGAAGIGGFAIDVTEREQMREELARFAAAQRETLDMLSTPVAIFGADRRLTFHNSAFARMFRLDPAWLSDRPHHSDLLERLRAARRVPEKADFQDWKRTLLDHYVNLLKTHEEMWYLPDDTTLRVVTQPHPLGGLQLLFEDVTERLVLERLYDTLFKVQQATLNNLHEGIAVFKPDGQLQLSNAVFADLWQFDRDWLATGPHLEQSLARAAGLFRGPEDVESLRTAIRQVILERSTSSGVLMRADDTVITFSGVPLPDGSALVTFLDITDSRRIEKALRERSEALEAADQLKSEFVANISYELRTPLTSIIGFAQMLEEGYLGTLSPKQAEYLRNILRSSDRLEVLINDILDLAVTRTGALVLDRMPVVVEPMVRAVVAMVEEQARGRGHALRVEVDSSAGTIEADERRLKQVLYNLLSNAIQFTPNGGTIQVDARGDPAGITLAVADTGVGIAETEQVGVFEQFQRGSNIGNRKGAGLGLALVKHFVEMHGGRVTLVSKVGEGTTVTVWLPRTAPPQERSEAA